MHTTLARMREKRSGDEGFTLIELLVVVVIIGVLVAIAVPVYLNYRKGAADKSAQSDLRGAVSAIEQYYTDNGNAYPLGPTSATASFNLSAAVVATAPAASGAVGLVTLSDKTSMTYIPSSAVAPTSYLICSTNGGGSGKVYIYNSASGGSVTASTAATPSMATCV